MVTVGDRRDTYALGYKTKRHPDTAPLSTPYMPYEGAVFKKKQPLEHSLQYFTYFITHAFYFAVRPSDVDRKTTSTATRH